MEAATFSAELASKGYTTRYWGPWKKRKDLAKQRWVEEFTHPELPTVIMVAAPYPAGKRGELWEVFTAGAPLLRRGPLEAAPPVTP